MFANFFKNLIVSSFGSYIEVSHDNKKLFNISGLRSAKKIYSSFQCLNW